MSFHKYPTSQLTTNLEVFYLYTQSENIFNHETVGNVKMNQTVET